MRNIMIEGGLGVLLRNFPTKWCHFLQYQYGYMCLDIMPQLEGRLPILKHIFEYRCTVCSDRYTRIQIVCVGNQSWIRVYTIDIELNSSKASQFFLAVLFNVASEASRNFLKN